MDKFLILNINFRKFY